jgi:hypothetical protein
VQKWLEDEYPAVEQRAKCEGGKIHWGLEALIKDAGRKVFLILDNLRVHHRKPVKAWVEERKDKIELFYLPSYSPGLNPEERLNAGLKQAIGSRVPARTKASLKTAAVDHMTMLEKSPERMKQYFKAQGRLRSFMNNSWRINNRCLGKAPCA